MQKQHVKISGKVRVVHKDANLNLISDITHCNDIVDSGLAYLASRAINASAAVMSHIALGDSVVAVAPADVALGNELGREAIVLAVSVANVVTYETSFGPGVATGAITEAGIFNAPAAGTMLNRLVFPVINKGALDTIEVEWTVTFADDGV